MVSLTNHHPNRFNVSVRLGSSPTVPNSPNGYDASCPDLQTFATHRDRSATGKRNAPDGLHKLPRTGNPLLVRHDAEDVRLARSRKALRNRAPTLWRCRKRLPVPHSANIVSLGEVITPTVDVPRIARKFSGGELLIKPEGMLPTASFKARGQTEGISMKDEHS